MKCYNHHETDAVGICKNCNKGLCPGCAADVGNGIACKNCCEQSVKDINALIQKSKGVYKQSSAVNYTSALIYGLFALFFISYPLFFDSALMSIWIPLGIIFLIGMVITIYRGTKFESK